MQAVRTIARTQAAPAMAACRGMATLKQLVETIDTTKNIAKITSSMKMVAAAKLKGDEMRLAAGRPFARWVDAAFSPPLQVDNVTQENYPVSGEFGEKPLFVLVTSDKGLCGAVNSGILKTIKAVHADFEEKTGNRAPIVIVGEKGRPGMTNLHGEDIKTSINGNWSVPTNFTQTSALTLESLRQAPEGCDGAVIFFNTYVSAIAYAQSWRYVPFVNGHLEEGASTEEEMPYAEYEVEPENRGEALDNFSEYALTSAMYDAFIENATAFQSSQMSAMENATSNANEMIETLSLRYNRARQAKITTELCEIVAGAAALEG
jgi:F-type H+-transporting ATPase subunit gamma